MLLGTAAAAWQPLAEDSLHWSSVVSPCSLGSSTANVSATALPEHAWLRVQFVLTHNASADAPDPHMLLLDGAAPHSALSLGTEHEPAPGCGGTRASRFDMFWQHTASSAELRFGRACDANSDLHRPGVHWDDLWCGDDVAWGVQDFTLTTSTGALDWDVPGVESFENVTSRLVLIGAASALTLPLSLDAALQHLDLLPTAGSSMLPLSGTLPRSLLSLTLGLSSDRMLTSTVNSFDELKPPETIKVDVPLSGSLPPTLQKLSWQLDELRPGLSGTLPASLLWIDAAGLIGDQGRLGWQPRLSGTLPAGVLAPRSNASCAHEDVYKMAYEFARRGSHWARQCPSNHWLCKAMLPATDQECPLRAGSQGRWRDPATTCHLWGGCRVATAERHAPFHSSGDEPAGRPGHRRHANVWHAASRPVCSAPRAPRLGAELQQLRGRVAALDGPPPGPVPATFRLVPQPRTASHRYRIARPSHLLSTLPVGS